ncbi:MAG TPA: MBL fold metallo-hydrolase [Candidatus Paceibacterota bacterium]|nr:MBL fold metallo-hydrolase [Candidatus Paceibacterota bacterium]
MVISYLGGQNIKVTQGDLTLSFNPPSKDSKLKSTKFGSDIVLVSLDHEDFNGIENASFGDREPFAIKGPGEYEVRGVQVRGFGAPSSYDGSASINTIYSVSLEGMNLAFMGALGTGELPQAAKQALDDIDILFMPVGGEGVVDAAASYKLAVGLEPKAVVPMPADSESLKKFLKEAGAEGAAVVDKLTVKKKDLDGKEGEVIVLSA